MSDVEFDDEWEYDAYRVGRATRTAEVAAPDGSRTIEEGTVVFEEINTEDHWMWEEDSWVSHYVAPDGGIGFDGGVVLTFEKLGILEFPEPMTEKEAHEWLVDEPERWEQLKDERLESDVTAADLGIPKR